METSGEFSYEVKKFVDNGDYKNKIDYLILSDGFTIDEKDKFFELAEVFLFFFNALTVLRF